MYSILKNIHYPLQFIIPSILCFVSIAVIYVKRKKLFDRDSKIALWSAITCFLIIYGLIVSAAFYHDVSYQWKLKHLDLDANGVFSSNERTIEQREIYFKYQNKTPRNLSLLTGALFGLLFGLIIYHLSKIDHFIIRKISRRKKN